MNYRISILGVKDTTREIIEYIENNIEKIDLIITIDESVMQKNDVSGFSSLQDIAEKYNITIFKTKDYYLNDALCKEFFENNTFELGISMGWQRIIPEYILKNYKYGIFGFHGSCGYLPYGRGRSPLNWSIINGDSRFIMNLFKYDEKPDSSNVFENVMFQINEFDTIRSLQYKNLLCAKDLITRLLNSYKNNNIVINSESHDIDTWYKKRCAEDGKIDFSRKTRDIYNLIRGVSKPFPGAFAYRNQDKVIIWDAVPFDQMLNFSSYCPGQVIDIFDGKPIIRTIDGSLLINEYESILELQSNDILI